LRTLARGMGFGEGLAVPVLDAHKGEVYCAAYARDAQGELVERAPPFHAAPAVAAGRLRELAPNAPLWLAGECAWWNGLDSQRRAAGKLLWQPLQHQFFARPRPTGYSDQLRRIAITTARHRAGTFGIITLIVTNQVNNSIQCAITPVPINPLMVLRRAQVHRPAGVEVGTPEPRQYRQRCAVESVIGVACISRIPGGIPPRWSASR